MVIFKAAVVGAGTMGGSIAQVVSTSGLPVILKDVDPKMLDAGMAKARAIYAERVHQGKMTADQVEAKMALIRPQLDYSGFDDVDLVIEAVPEKMPLKLALLRELDSICHSGAIFASNTSALAISTLAAATHRPEQVIGLHFFNPAYVMKLVEVIPGTETSSDTIKATVAFAQSLRKLPVIVKESPGFLVNRLLTAYLVEAIFALQEGAADSATIDAAMVGAGMSLGPFRMADMVGIDVCEDVAHTIYLAYGERLHPPALLHQMVLAGRLGHKTGKGFYTYEDASGATTADLIALAQAETGVTGTPFTPDRLLLPLINEAIRTVEEGITGLGEIGLAMQAGAGFPQGPLEMADERGLDDVLAGLEALQATLGDRFAPAPLLREKVAAGNLGRKTGAGFFQYA